MSYLDKVLGWFNLSEVTDQYSFWLGMVVMAIIVITIIAIGALIRFVRLVRRPTKGISIKSSKGEMQVSLAAIKDFVHSSLKDISYIKLSKVSLSGSKHSQKLKLTITAPRGMNLPSLNDEIREKIDNGLIHELGIKTVKTDLISLKRFNDKKSGESYQFTKNPDVVIDEKDVLEDLDIDSKITDK